MKQASKRIPESAKKKSGIFAEPHAGIIPLKMKIRIVLEGLRGEDQNLLPDRVKIV